jgi:hypothetical protein
VHTGQFSDAAAEQHLAAVLIERRDKIARAYLPAVTPIVDAQLSATGVLTCENAACAAGVADAPAGYRATWSTYDNESGRATSLGEIRVATPVMQPPGGLPTVSGAIVKIDVRAEDAGHPAWDRPVHLYFRRSPGGWVLVGLDHDLGAAGRAGAPATD